MKRLVAVVLLASAIQANATRTPVAPMPMFGVPTCNTDAALDHLRSQMKATAIDIRPTYDEFFPWSSLVGYWTDDSRDLVIRVSRMTSGNNREALRVEFRSLCTNHLIAAGNRPIRNGDLQLREGPFSLLMMASGHGLRNTWWVTLAAPVAAHGRIQVIIRDYEDSVSIDDSETLDSFLAKKI